MKHAAGLTLLLLLGGCSPRRSRLPQVLAVLPDFTLTAVGPQKEAPFGRRDMLGKVWIADFIFTRCGGPCPLMTQRLSDLARTLPAQVGLLTVTVDPEGDTPQRLRAYARNYGADLQRWVFLRGTVADTYRLVYEGFHLAVSTDPKASPETRVTHSTRFVLVDKNAAVRGFYDVLDGPGASALARDAQLLLEEGK